MEGWEKLKFIHFRSVYILQLKGMKGSALGAMTPRPRSRKGAGTRLSRTAPAASVSEFFHAACEKKPYYLLMW